MGDFVVESDGSFFEVVSVVQKGARMIFGLANVNGYMLAATEARVSAKSVIRVLA